MNNELYEMIYKRKSFHLFRGIGNACLTQEELEGIERYINQLVPLDPTIKIKIKIVKDGVTCHRGQEYCILFYSEKKENYLQNIGYLGEQLDLYLVSKNIGTLWFGIGKVDEKTVDGLDYVIMLALAKVDSKEKFRKDLFKSKRKDIQEIWQGNKYLDIANIVRFAPSACNSQPWYVEEKEHELLIYRHKNKRGIMPQNMVKYYNQIDMGIFLCFLDLCLNKHNIVFTRQLCIEKDHDALENLAAIYQIKD